MDDNLNTWQNLLDQQRKQQYFCQLMDFVESEYQTQNVFPPKNLIFNAFCQCALEDVKVVILGQDPYHNPGEAHGLAFSVPDGIKIPPSLRNIYKQINTEFTEEYSKANIEQLKNLASGNLTRWAKQGVLLLNATLTVRAHQPQSHQKKGWETFTDNVVSYISNNCTGIVFMLWGSYAISKSKLVDPQKHLVLTAAHPSPLSAYKGFFGCNHFSTANKYLQSIGKTPIDWL